MNQAKGEKGSRLIGKVVLLSAALGACVAAGCQAGAKQSSEEAEMRLMQDEVRGVLGLKNDVALTEEHYLKVTEFRPTFSRLTTDGLAPVARMANLEVLIVPENSKVDDISCVTNLTKLRGLALKNTRVASLAPLERLKNLRSLSLDNCAVSDVSVLAGLENLESLSLTGTAVKDLSPLADLQGLRDLSVDGTAVTDLSPLRGLTGLSYVTLPDGSGWNGPRGGAPPAKYKYDYVAVRPAKGQPQARTFDYAKFVKGPELKGSSPAAIGPDGSSVFGAGGGAVKAWDIGTGSEKKVFGRHPSGLLCLAVSSDGSLVASSGSFERVVSLADVESGSERKVEGHTAAVTALAFAPGGTLLASGSKDKAVRIVDAASSAVRHTFKHGGFGATCLAFSPDGQTLASGGSDGVVILWDLLAGSERARLEDHKYVVEEVAFSPDGTLLAVANGPEVALYDAADGSKVRTVAGPDKALSVAFSPDGKTLATGTPFGEILVWDVAGGKKKGVLRVHGNRASTDAISTVAFSGDGRFLLSAGSTIQVWKAPG